MTVVGTRPEIIRLSRLIPKFDLEFNHILIHTGQNFDPMLSDIFFEELRVRRPDAYLNIDNKSLGKTIGDLFIKFEEVLISYKPDGVFILGDTNSSLVAILAKRMQIPVYHWEAGNRSFDENVPEETNRTIVDHTAHFNIAYSNYAAKNLRNEGMKPERIFMSGSPMKEVLDFYRKDINKSDALDRLGLEKGKYFLASFHRQENVDDPKNLKAIISVFEAIAEKWKLPILISTHPRTKKKLDSIGEYATSRNLIFHEPLGYFDYVNLQFNSFCVISDSGSVSEESAILGFKAITIRSSMERQEALEAGTIVMTGLLEQDVLSGIEQVVTKSACQAPAEYLFDTPTVFVTELVKGTVLEFETWSGVRRIDLQQP